MARKEDLVHEVIIACPPATDNRRSIRTPENLNKLMRCWEMGITTSNGLASELGVTPAAISKWIEDDENLKELRDICYAKVNVLARTNIHKALKKGSVETSKWFLERTDPEFSKKETPQVNVAVISVSDREKALAEYLDRFVVPEDTTPRIEERTENE